MQTRRCYRRIVAAGSEDRDRPRSTRSSILVICRPELHQYVYPPLSILV